MTTRAAVDQLAQKQSHISVQRYFEISLLLMLATGFLTVATTGRLDPISVVVVIVALGIKLWSYVREADYSLSPATVTRISIFYIFFFALDFLIFSAGPSVIDSMLAAAVHLILFAALVKVFSARTYRDYGYLATLSFLMILSSAVLTVGTSYLAFFTLYVLFAISTFISYEIKRGMESARRAPEGPFPAPARNRSAIENALMITAGGLAVGIFLLATVLFFFIPRYRTGYLTSVSMQAQNITGFSETVNLGDMRKILQSPMVVMRVIPEGSPRLLQGVKWRGVGLTSFDGRHWYNDNTEQFPVQAASYQRFLLPPPEGWQRRPHRLVRYRVLRAAISTDVLFVAPEPEEVSGQIRMLNLDQTSSLHSPQHAYTPFAYNAVSELGVPSPRELEQAPAEYPQEIRVVYLHLPPQLDPRVTALAQKITANLTNNYDRALAIQNYLRDNYAYTLDPPAIEPQHPIESFLFKSKSGFCEYFAAAMAVLLRTLNIPSRLVNGFQTGTYNSIGKDFVVRARDAHSWVEVYFPNYGWITFDPTPPDPNPAVAGTWDNYVDAFGLFWSEWIINYDFSHQIRLARQIERESHQFQEGFQKRFEKMKARGIKLAYRVEAWLMQHKLLMLLLMLGIMATLVLAEKASSLAELRFLWAWNFARRDVTLSPQEATLTYQRLLKALRKKGYQKAPSQTPKEFALRFVGTPLGPGLLEFTRLYNMLRFGKAAIPLSRLRQLLEEVAK